MHFSIICMNIFLNNQYWISVAEKEDESAARLYRNDRQYYINGMLHKSHITKLKLVQ